MDYQKAGVNIDAGNELVSRIKKFAPKTFIPGVMGNIGGFSGLFDLSQYPMKQPILVASTDGVGTKLKLAQQCEQHTTIGIDLVAMCVNDIIVTGAKPLFFLDYFATGKLSVTEAEKIIKGIAQGCEQAQCALIGGETAEMPGLYQAGEYDLAGFCVGIVDKEKIIDGSSVKAGDYILGLPSSGIHSNGYSLVRKILEINHTNLHLKLAGKTLQEILLTPTKIYVPLILDLLKHFPIKAMAHITGGGILENLPRVLPPNVAAIIDTNSWPELPIFDYLQKLGNVADIEMYRTFNMGIGMVLVVDPQHAAAIIQHSSDPIIKIGVIETSNDSRQVILQ